MIVAIDDLAAADARADSRMSLKQWIRPCRDSAKYGLASEDRIDVGLRMLGLPNREPAHIRSTLRIVHAAFVWDHVAGLLSQSGSWDRRPASTESGVLSSKRLFAQSAGERFFSQFGQT